MRSLRLRVLSFVVLCSLDWVAAASPLSGAAGRGDRDRNRGRPVPTVRGYDGQPDLELDRGRSLRGYPLRRRDTKAAFGVTKPKPSSPQWLTSLEKVRLDARRIAAAPRLGLRQKLQRFVAVVERRLPALTDQQGRYQSAATRHVKRWGRSRLSAVVSERVGSCRERAFLLHTMLKEVGIRSRVVYCEVYDPRDQYRGDHAYVRARVGRQRVLLDPSNPTPVQPLRQTWIYQERDASGQQGRRRAVVTQDGWLYLPTWDLVYLSERR